MIFCEDTRHSIKLLNAYDIKKPLFSCHKFNEREAAEKIIAAAKDGGKIAVISDAGMPVVSDPGNAVCKALRESQTEFTVIPGANAALSALVLSAFPADKFVFIGFLPDKAGERRQVLSEYRDCRLTMIIHAAPQDVDRVTASLYEVFGERNACAVREITKIHEQTIYFKLSEGLKGEKRGEYVLVVEGAGERENALNVLSERQHILHYINEGMDKKEAVKRVAKDRGVSKSEIYKFSLDIDAEN